MKPQSLSAKTIWFPLLAVLLILLAGCQSASLTQGNSLDSAPVSSCYKVELLDFKWVSEVATTWRYRIGQPGCTQPVHGWMLELPACASVVDASPARWDIASQSLHDQLNGVKWQSATSFQNGEFSVTLTGDLAQGMIRAGVEGQDSFIDNVQGPVCRDLALQPTAIASVPAPITGGPTAKVKVQSANCRAMPVGKAPKVTLLYRNQEAEILGRNEDPNNPWWYVKIPGQEASCWLWGKTIATNGDTQNVPVVSQ